MTGSDRNFMRGNANSSLVKKVFSLFKNIDPHVIKAAESVSRYRDYVIIPVEAGDREEVYIYPVDDYRLADSGTTKNAVARLNVERGRYDSLVTLLYDFSNKKQLEKASRFRDNVLVREKIEYDFDVIDGSVKDLPISSATRNLSESYHPPEMVAA